MKNFICPFIPTEISILLFPRHLALTVPLFTQVYKWS